MFERSRELLEQYYCALLCRGCSLRGERLLQEVRARLRSLAWLHSELIALDRALETAARAERRFSDPDTVMKCIFMDISRPDCSRNAIASLPCGDEDRLRTLLEAFYYAAHRVRDILRDGRNELHGLPRFEVVGVRTVRNHLVEHPTKANGVLVVSVAAGGPVGPQLKPLRWTLDEPGSLDAGLHANAAEFSSALERAFEAALATLAEAS